MSAIRVSNARPPRSICRSSASNSRRCRITLNRPNSITAGNSDTWAMAAVIVPPGSELFRKNQTATKTADHAGAHAHPDSSSAGGGSVLDTGEASRTTHRGKSTMPTITTKDGTTIYYKDWGSGRPVVFSHGWPLSADAWEDQMMFLGSRGYRCIAHDR